ncbi:MAG TPA: Rieske 2Fe-2S domain-containing protein, partial [Ktedonobacterales bacterium]
YKARKQHLIDAEKASWPRGQVEILPALKDWFEPLLAIGDVTCVGINGRVLMQLGDDEGVVLDYQNRSVYAWEGQEWEYRFRFDPALIESLILRHVEDWINELFLSCRFEAERNGAYNEYVYNFFKCLTPERLEYAEGYYAERSADQQLMELEGYRIQRRCPHLKADLARFGHVENGVLTCTMHGWQFELATGKCLTSDDRKLYSVPIAAELANGNGAHAAEETPAYEPPPAVRCKHCWYIPPKDRTAGTERPARRRASGDDRATGA